MPLFDRDDEHSFVKQLTASFAYLQIGGREGVTVVGDLNANDFELISFFLRKTPSCTWIKFVACSLGADTSAFYNFICDNPQIESLTLENISLSDAHISLLVEILNLNKIQYFDLSNIDLRAININKLSMALRKSTSINIISLDGCTLGDKQFKSFMLSAIMKKTRPYGNLHLNLKNPSLNALAMAAMVGRYYLHHKLPIYISLKAYSVKKMLRNLIDEYDKSMQWNNVFLIKLFCIGLSLADSQELEPQQTASNDSKPKFSGLFFKHNATKPHIVRESKQFCLPIEIVKHAATFLPPPRTKKVFTNPSEVIAVLKECYEIPSLPKFRKKVHMHKTLY